MLAFGVSEREIWPGCGELRIEGEIDLATADRLGAALDRAASRHRHVLVDLAACEFIDASGLRVLLGAHRALAEQDAQLLLYGVHGQVRRLLSVTGVAAKGLVLTASKDAAEEIRARLPSERLAMEAGAVSELSRRSAPSLAV